MCPLPAHIRRIQPILDASVVWLYYSIQFARLKMGFLRFEPLNRPYQPYIHGCIYGRIITELDLLGCDEEPSKIVSI